MPRKRILFAGYAKVHFVCFLPVYQELAKQQDVEVFLSGGHRTVNGDEVSFDVAGFYDEFPVDHSRVLAPETAKAGEFDVLVCAHLSDTLFPRSVGRTVQIFHGVSFKNLAVREKALRYDLLCLPGRYHADRYRKQGLIRPDGPQALVTGFPKLDRLVADDGADRAVLREMGMEPSRPTLLFAPTGDKHNALEIMGRELIGALAARGAWNLLVKPHDHPKRDIDWFAELADLTEDHVRLVRDKDVTPYLRAADLLLTDASSVALEYTLRDRPIVFLDTPKLLEKLARKAPALDLETYGRKLGTVVERAQDVPDVVEVSLANPGVQSAIRRAAALHLFHAPGGAAARVAGVVRHAAGLEPALPDGIDVVEPDPVA